MSVTSPASDVPGLGASPATPGKAGEPAWATDKPAGEMSLVEIAQQLERVTSWIEGERVRERAARAQYEALREEIEERVRQIREHATVLLEEQRRRMISFDGLLGGRTGSGTIAETKPQGAERMALQLVGGRGRSGAKLNISEAIMAIWGIERWRQPLTTEEIAEALPDTGYRTSAAPRSLKSAVNQTLAKLCRTGKVLKYRTDGTRIPERDTKSRARKYLAARFAPEDEE